MTDHALDTELPTYTDVFTKYTDIIKQLHEAMEYLKIGTLIDTSDRLKELRKQYNKHILYKVGTFNSHFYRCGPHSISWSEVVTHALVYKKPVALTFEHEDLKKIYDDLCKYLDKEPYSTILAQYLLHKKLGVLSLKGYEVSTLAL